MIIRPEQHWFLRLFDWHGSVLSKIVFRLLLNLPSRRLACWGLPLPFFSVFETAPGTTALLKRAICGERY